MFKKIFSIALLSIAAIFGVFNLTPNVSAEELPEVGIKEVEVKIGDKEIIIFATLFNSSDSLTTTPFTYLAMLKSINHFIPSSDPDLDLPALIVSAVEGEEYTILNPLEEKRASYLIPISPDLPQDNYDLSLNLILKDGRSVGYYYDVLRDYGANEKSNKTSYTEGFLAFNQESCGVARADGLIFPANEGPVFKPLERPVANCKVRNIGDKDLTVYPVVIWKEFFVYGRPSSGQRYYEKLEQPIFIRAGETKNVEVLLPDEEVPQVYQALVSFEDAGGNKKSFDMFFRWTIKGESGRVNAVSLVDAPKESYTKGETLALSVDYYGSVDLYWRDLEENISQTANFNLTAIVKDKNGEICGQKTVKLPTIEDGGLKNEVVDVALSKDCNGVSYSVSLISEDGNVVAQEEDILPVRKNIAGNLMPYFYLLTVLMAFIIFVMVFAIRKKKKSITGVYLLAFVFAATCFFGIFSETEAATTKPYTGVPSPSGYSGEAFTANDTNNGESSDKLYSYYTGGNNEVKIKDVYAYFDDYFAYTNEVPYVHFDYGSGYGGSCSNSALYIRVKMELVVGNSTYKLDIKKRSSSDGYDGKYIKEIIGSAMSDRNLNLEINPDNFANIYDSNGKLKDNANLIIYVTAVSRHAQDSTTPEGSYYKSTFTTPTNKTQYSSRSDALDASDDMKITIPLSSLPNPSVTLDANPTEVDYGGSSKLTWTTKDVDSCAEFNTNNDSQFSGSITVMSSGSETIYNITKDNTYTLQCDKYLGSAVGKKNYLDTASVSVKPNPSCTASPSSTTTGSNVTFSSAVTGGTSPYTYSWSGTDISGTNTGSTLTKSYSTIGTKSATIKVTDKNNKIGEGTCTVSISSPDQCDSANNSCVSGSWSDLTDTSTKYKWKCGSLI
ncbi:MAG: hypothetical protein UT83_C0005G0021 [Parcubacteria group bacterium GW2011_GWA2_40_143]|nr:MAG: hypothetical protein UT83_C0005G0021 [Parcubacteria group bacterium GW2011_GWA2_40_143]